MGLDLYSLPEADRIVELPLDSPLEFGKLKQPGFFERLLQAEPKWLSFISRTHCRITLSSKQSNSLTVENLSANVISVGEQKLPKNEKITIQEGGCLAFLAAPQPPEEISFLVFAFRQVRQ